MPKISVVSPYFNRKLEIINTLKMMSMSSFKDFEFIVVDDASSQGHRLEDLVDTFPFLKVIRVEPKDKWFLNPCIPYNMGIAKATGDIIVLQSPECMYMGDVLQYVVDNSKDNQYSVFACYSLSEPSTRALRDIDFSSATLLEDIDKTIGGTQNRSCDTSGRYDTWFAHPVYRRCLFNFLVTMPMKDMKELGGFDERYYDGHSYDDSDLARRIVNKKMDVVFVEKPFCLHQYHPSVLGGIPNFTQRLAKNKAIFELASLSPAYHVKNSFL